LYLKNGEMPQGNPVEINSIDSWDYSFDGYLIVANKIPLKTTNSCLLSKIYWIESLQSLKNAEDYYYYYGSLDYTSRMAAVGNTRNMNDSAKYAAGLFCTFYRMFNSYSRPIYNSYLYDTKDMLTSDLFQDSIKFFEDMDGYVYTIFKCYFFTAILNVEMPITLIDNIEINKVRMLMPISDLIRFEQISDNEAIENGLVKSTIRIKAK
jgi:hypothetical protein